jgi:hypothetical protein
MQFFTRVLSLAAAAAPFIASAAPLASRAADDLIPGQYIIQLKPETDIASTRATLLAVPMATPAQVWSANSRLAISRPTQDLSILRPLRN